jgi:hypothetical protein
MVTVIGKLTEAINFQHVIDSEMRLPVHVYHQGRGGASAHWNTHGNPYNEVDL